MTTPPEDVHTKPFRLLDLPAELWSKIGKMAIDGCATVEWDNIIMSKKRRAKGVPIAQTCRALRDELLPYFLKTRVDLFWFSVADDFESELYGRWFRAVDERYRRDLRGVVVDFEHTTGLDAWVERMQKIWGVQFTVSKERNPDGDHRIVFT